MIILHFPLIESYDVLQVKRDGQWYDFSTLRTTVEAQKAVEFCTGKVPRDFREGAEAWRVVQSWSGNVRMTTEK